MKNWKVVRAILKFIFFLIIFIALAILFEESHIEDLTKVFVILSIISAFLLGLIYRKEEK